MKKVLLCIFLGVFIINISTSQTLAEKNEVNEGYKYEEIEVKDIPLKVKTSLMKEAILVKNLLYSAKVRTNGAYIYSFIIKQRKEKWNFQYNDQGELLKKAKWVPEEK